MALRWNPQELGHIHILPDTIAKKHLLLASHLQLKVLLWFAADTDGEFDVSACATALHKTSTAVTEALQYWIAAGVLLSDGTPDAQPASVETAPPAATETAVTEPAAAETPKPAVRPLAVKPQMKDVLEKQKTCPEFSHLLQYVSARLGKPITHGNMETLLYLYDTAAIPAQVIMLVVAYAVSRGKYSMRYIETVALNWLDNGITTVAAAEEHLRLLEQMDDAGERVRKLAGMAKEPDYRQRGMAHTWLYVWQLSEPLIQVALDYAAAGGKPPIAYANTLLGDWHAQGITDPEEAKKLLTPEKRQNKKRGQTAETSLDLHSYEQLLADYVPTLPAKKGKR